MNKISFSSLKLISQQKSIFIFQPLSSYSYLMNIDYHEYMYVPSYCHFDSSYPTKYFKQKFIHLDK